MKALAMVRLLGVSALLVTGLAACDKPGPAESAGKKIDQTADNIGARLSNQGDKAGVVMDDSEITAKVKAALFAEPGLKSMQISVDTVKGVVTLSGTVDSQQNSDKAKALAGAVSGVKTVENKLLTK